MLTKVSLMLNRKEVRKNRKAQTSKSLTEIKDKKITKLAKTDECFILTQKSDQGKINKK